MNQSVNGCDCDSSVDPLTPEQVQAFLRDGVLVVDNVLSSDELDTARAGLQDTMLQHRVDINNLEETGLNLQQLSSTNGSGGVLDLFYDDWKMKVASNRYLYEITRQLWKVGYCHDGQASIDDMPDKDRFKWHPYSSFDPLSKGFMYIDRIGFRLPTALSERLGALQYADCNMSAKKRKKLTIQRSLTPHLDCCPETYYTPLSSKWRPIQCFVSLSDTVESNHGGFEVVKGFHREFESWSKQRPPTVLQKKIKNGNGHATSDVLPPPCIGEYTHIRPNEDSDVFKRVEHVAVKAGSAVFWDNRLPHANAYRHDGTEPRAVVYCSFLPNIPLNREYVKQQLAKYRQGVLPSDQWIETNKVDYGRDRTLPDDPFVQKLLGILPW